MVNRIGQSVHPGSLTPSGFHLNEIYSSWVRLEAMVRAFLSARAGGDEAMKTFANTSLGESWMESGEAPDWRRLYDRRERWPAGTVPADGLILTAGADVQKDRIEVDVWAWGRGLESWLVDHVVIDRGPEYARSWDQLAALLGRTWPHALGGQLQIARLAVDTAYEAPAVYAWARAQGLAQVAPVKGVEGFNRTSPVSGPTYVDATVAGKRLRRGARLWTVAVSTFKAETYRFLRLERPTDEEIAGGARIPAGTIHLPDWVESADVVPSSIRSLAVIAEPRLDPASGAVPWFLVASPAAIDTIEYAYIEGQEGVALETRMGFDVDGVEVRARLDFGAKAIDWRSLYKNP